MSSSTLTDEQRERIAKNKAEAIRRRDARIAREKEAAALSVKSTNIPITTNNVNSSNLSNIKSSAQNRSPQQRSVSNVIPSYSNTTKKPYAACSSAASTSKEGRVFPLFEPGFHKELYAVNNKMPVKPPTRSPPSVLTKSNVNVKVVFQILNADKLMITFSPFHLSVVNVLKTLSTRTFDEKTRSWHLALHELQTAQTRLINIRECKITIELPPKNVISMMTNFKLEDVPNDMSSSLDPELLNKLFPYQKTGVQFAIAREGRVLIADEMGLGKSLQALAIARYYKSEWPLLIVCPSSVKSAWKHQLNTFIPSVTKIYTVEKGSDPIPDSNTPETVVIMSYDLMAIREKELEIKAYSVVIWDECHLLKDAKAKRTKVATILAKKSRRTVLLSGTPALSRPAELYSQIRLIDPQLFKNFKDFAIRYCDGRQGKFCFEAKGCTNSDELKAILSKRLLIRRLKCDVLKELPDKRREVVYLSGSSIESRMKSLKQAKAAFEATKNDKPVQNNESLLEYFSATGIVKAAAVCEHILDNYFHPDAPERKVLIFAHHQVVLDTIQIEVNRRGLKCIRIDGTTPSKDRGDLCKSFQEDPSVVIAVLSITAAGVGITLTAASVVVFAELHFNPGILVQAEDRAHRVGQKDSVFVQYLVAKNTADDAIWPMVQRKLDILGQVDLSSDTFRNAENTHMKIGAPQSKRPKLAQVVIVD